MIRSDDKWISTRDASSMAVTSCPNHHHQNDRILANGPPYFGIKPDAAHAPTPPRRASR